MKLLICKRHLMVLSPYVLMVLSLCTCLSAHAFARQSPTRYVDPFVGTGGHGHTFPGATLPFSMVQLSPDTRLSGWDGCSGYHYSDSFIYGFSHTHLSGTGALDYGDILLMPTAGEIHLNALGPDGQTSGGYASAFSHRNERARPGFYSVMLDDEGIFAELTTTDRVGLHRYTYPPDRQANIILDLTHRDRVLDSGLKIVGDRRIEGFRRSRAWAEDQVVYFVAEFSRPFTSFGIEREGTLRPGLRDAAGKAIKAFFSFAPERGGPVLVKVALSAVGVEGATKNLDAELNDWNFERVRLEADTVWARELKKIEVSGGSDAELKNFYTSLYHTMLAPNLFMDADGRFRGRDLKVHRAADFTNYTVFSLWDTFRAAHPLYTLVEQRRTLDFIKTFLAQYEHGGRLPVWELAANETDTMIGYHAVSVIADAAVKGISGFDLERAFAAMKHDAEMKHFGLAAYQTRGYISSEDEPESVSKTLEYAYDDWCIAQTARLLGRDDDYRRFITRAQFYKNLFDAETGFMRAKRNGRWLAPFDPREVNFNFTEANAWQYSFFVPHDIGGLVALSGGPAEFERKLDALFSAESTTTGREQADITGLIGQYAHGNEPSHHMAYLYNFVGRAWKTQRRVRQIMDEFYAPRPDGLIGNEDCGQMSAWYVLSAAGFYPVTPAAPFYVIGTPLFREARFRLENGRTFTVRARRRRPRDIYIQSATLNGRPYSKSYITHADIMRGGELSFVMGARPHTRWGAGAEDVPVTSITRERFVPVPVFDASGDAFRERMRVGLKTTVPGLKLFYTTDGTEPDERSTPYQAPFEIRDATTVKAVAFDATGGRSFVVAARFRPVPHDWTIRLLSRYAPQYSAGGELALIDGVRGGENFRTGAWQGYQGTNVEAVVDLGRVEEISKVGAGFLQDVRSWIWMPTRVEFELSPDGLNYTKLPALLSPVSEQDESLSIRDFVSNFPQQRARYVRMKAYTYGTIPAWHAGAGGQAWVFVDEIIVE